jgi:glutamate synthase domain-containing protein 3
VVEGVGDHGCEYMTGGVVVILGPTGSNFGAGMSGGLAFMYDTSDGLPKNINAAMIGLERLSLPEEISSLKQLIAQHAKVTTSPYAQALLTDWDAAVAKFWKVVPFAPTPDAPKPVLRYPAG